MFHQYTILVDAGMRDKIVNEIRDKGCGCAVFYPKPLHLHPHFAKLGYKEGDFPVSEEIANRVISLPVHPMLSDDELKEIVRIVKEAVE